MPLPLIPLIAAGAGALSQGINAASVGAANRQDRKFQMLMYDRQRADALSDWERNNSYNHPSAQMERLKQAGLNPNLVYGGGASAVSAPVRGSSPSGVRTTAPQFDLGSVLGQFIQIQMLQAQTDNLRAINDVKIQEAALKREQSQLANALTSRSRFDLQLDSEMRNTSIQARSAALDKVRADIDYTVHGNKRAEDLNRISVREGVERILNSQQSRAESQSRISLNAAQEAKVVEEIKSLPLVRALLEIDQNTKGLDNVMKSIEVQMAQKGIFKGDPFWQRLVVEIADLVGKKK